MELAWQRPLPKASREQLVGEQLALEARPELLAWELEPPSSQGLERVLASEEPEQVVEQLQGLRSPLPFAKLDSGVVRVIQVSDWQQVPQLAEELPHRLSQILSIFELHPGQTLRWHLQEVLGPSRQLQLLSSLESCLPVPAGVTGSVI